MEYPNVYTYIYVYIDFSVADCFSDSDEDIDCPRVDTNGRFLHLLYFNAKFSNAKNLYQSI